MSCIDNTTIEQLADTLEALGKARKGTAVSKLLKSIQDNADLSMHFEPNANSKSKLNEYTAEGNARPGVARKLEAKFSKVTKDDLNIKPSYDTSFSNEGVSQGWQSIISYLFDKHGNLDSNVASAMGLVTGEWLANDALNTMAVNRDDKDVAGMLGVDKKAVITQAMRNSINGLDGLLNKTVNTLGAKIYGLLGIKAKNSKSSKINNKVIEATLKSELGLFALKTLEKEGVLTLGTYDVSIKRNGVNAVEKWKGYKFNVRKNNRSNIKAIENQNMAVFPAISFGMTSKDWSKNRLPLTQHLEIAENKGSIRGIFLTAKQAVPERKDIVNEGPTGEISEVSKDHKEAIIKSSSTPVNWNKGYVNAVLGLDKVNKVIDTEGNVKGSYLRDLLGYKEPSEVLDVRATAVTGKNNMINKVIEDMYNTYVSTNGDTMYGKWKVITNNRFMLDSNMFNWQDKKLHRFAVDIGNNLVKLDANNLEDNMHKMFKLGLAQAFDIGIDKKSFESSIKEVDTLISKLDDPSIGESAYTKLEDFQGTTEYIAAVKNVLDKLSNSDIGSLGEIEHAIRGAVELVNYQFAMTKGLDYSTGLMIETDAITSGYAIKGLQFPIYADESKNLLPLNAVLKELEKVGIFAEDSNYGNYGARSEAKATDAYQTPAKDLSNRLDPKYKDIIGLLDPKAKFTENTVNISRNFMKQPFMVLNYGSTVKSIISNSVNEAVENFYDLVQTAVLNKDAKGNLTNDAVEAQAKVNKILNEVAISNNMSKAEHTALKNTLIDKTAKLDSDQLKVLENTILKVIKDPLTATLENKYGHFIKLSNTLNNSFKLQFKLAKQEIDKRIIDLFTKKKEAANGSAMLVAPINREEMAEILKDVHDLLPVFNTALFTDEGKKAQGLIAKRERVNKDSDSMKGNVNNTGKVVFKTDLGSNGKIKENAMTHAALELYELVESATGGAVIPIHFFDASIQAKVLKTFDVLGVHDANYATLDKVDNVTKYYNKVFYDLSKNYSLSDEVLDTLLNTLEATNENVFEEMSTKELKPYLTTLEGLALVNKNAAEMRRQIFNTPLRIQHSYFEGPNGFAEFNSKDNKEPLADKSAELAKRVAKQKERLNSLHTTIKEADTLAETVHKRAKMAVKDVLAENENNKEKC